jgi:DNA-binding SARP family transcriptional activator
MQITLLGDFRLTWDDCVVSAVGAARMRSLLDYLVLRRGTPQLRSQLALLFWPDSSEQQALTKLRYLLHELRQALPDAGDFVHADSRTVEWKADAAVCGHPLRRNREGASGCIQCPVASAR